MSGSLYIVATPIGNLADLSKRTKETFEKVDLILAEDTRITIKLLNYLGIKKRMISCHEFNEKARLNLISEYSQLQQSIALVSDAGMPLISDPGNQIVRQAIACGMNIIPIPGPSAALLALVASGLPCERFAFEGFLPNKSGALKNKLTDLKTEERTLIIYESPHRLIKTLNSINEIFGDRDICIAKEITKKHEQFWRGRISTLVSQLTECEILGEYVIIVAGYDSKHASAQPEKEKIELLIEKMLAEGESIKSIVQSIANTHKMKRSEIYQLALKTKENR